jgi:hypothetical protein
MKSIKLPSIQLYNFFENKTTLLNSIHTISNLITKVENFNIMNEKLNRKIYNNIKNGNFKMCLTNDLAYNLHTFNYVKESEHKLITHFFRNISEKNYINYLETNWIIDELSKGGWNIYYDNEQFKISGKDTTARVYNHIYITPYEMDKYKINSNTNIIPYNGLQIIDALKLEYNELNTKYKQNDQKISELL